jgi:glycosyltransferase involved in cell wall biosynthesis
MGRNQKKAVKVILFKGHEIIKNAASFNRNEAVEKMIAQSFDYCVVSPSLPFKSLKPLIIRKFVLQFSVLFCLFRIFSITRDKTFRYVFFLRSINPFVALVSWCICRISGVKMAIERNEFPSVCISGGAINKWAYNTFILPWHYRLFDLLFLMTGELQRFFSGHVRKGTLIFNLPMTVDFERFKNPGNIMQGKYIFYAGSLSEQKDGVESLIMAFSRFAKSNQDYKLFIAGSTKDGSGEKRLQNMINSLSLDNHIRLLGSVSRDEIPAYISSSSILVLPRPDSLQARGGFPTKLGEYLASGKPVIVTRVGEIPAKLNEDQVFFISAEHIVEELTEKIIYIAQYYDNALETGKRGKAAAYDKFSLESNKGIIENAINALFNNKTTDIH